MQIVICRGCDQQGVLPFCSFSPSLRVHACMHSCVSVFRLSPVLSSKVSSAAALLRISHGCVLPRVWELSVII